jgi:hypothetical protein
MISSQIFNDKSLLKSWGDKGKKKIIIYKVLVDVTKEANWAINIMTLIVYIGFFISFLKMH